MVFVFSVDGLVAAQASLNAALIFTVVVLVGALVLLVALLGRLVVSDGRRGLVSGVVVGVLALIVAGFGVLYWAASRPVGTEPHTMWDGCYVALGMLTTVGSARFRLAGSRLEIVQAFQLAYDLVLAVFVVGQLLLGRDAT